MASSRVPDPHPAQQTAGEVERNHAFGQRIRSARLGQGLTLDMLAEKSKLEVRHLQYIEAGRANVTLDTLYKLADGLSLPPGELVEATSQTPLKVDEPIASALAATDVESILRGVATQVAALRRDCALTQQDLADKAGLSLTVVRDLEACRRSPSLRSLVAVATALSIAPASLLQLPADAATGTKKPRIRARRE